MANLWHRVVKVRRGSKNIHSGTKPDTNPFDTVYDATNRSMDTLQSVNDNVATMTDEIQVLEKIHTSILSISLQLENLDEDNSLGDVATNFEKSVTSALKQTQTVKKLKTNVRQLKNQLDKQVPALLELPDQINSFVYQTIAYYSSDARKVDISEPISVQMLPLTIQEWIASTKHKYDTLMHNVRLDPNDEEQEEEEEEKDEEQVVDKEDEDPLDLNDDITNVSDCGEYEDLFDGDYDE
jgi:hypothetical protein